MCFEMSFSPEATRVSKGRILRTSPALFFFFSCLSLSLINFLSLFFSLFVLLMTDIHFIFTSTPKFFSSITEMPIVSRFFSFSFRFFLVPFFSFVFELWKRTLSLHEVCLIREHGSDRLHSSDSITTIHINRNLKEKR